MKTSISKQSQQIMPLVLQYKHDVEKLYGDRLKYLILYGSYARGDIHEFSDIDLLVVLDNENDLRSDRKIISELNFRYTYDNDLIFSAFPVSYDRFQTLNMPFYINVRKDGVMI